MNLNAYRDLILGWARDRNLIEGSTAEKQLDKLFEENGEYAGSSARSGVADKRDEMLLKMQDGLGDVFVVTCILAAQMGVELDFDQMEEYQGEGRNGVFYLALGCLAGLVESQYQEALDDSILDTPDHFYFAVAAAQAVAKRNGFDFLACIEMAWNEIKDRKGRMVDGVFVKEADL